MTKPKLTEEMIRELCIACTRNESGQHFTTWMLHAESLEKLGLIEIDRPVHATTGIAYSEEEWSLDVTPEGVDVVDSHPELHPA